MPSPAERPPLIALVGPTGVGKTALSIRLAQRIGAEIISADSRLFYRGLDIGTDKPSPAVRRAVPHHLVDFLEPDETYSLAEFQAAVIRISGEIRARGRLPLLAGGSGQYVRAIVEGWRIPEQPPDERLRAALFALADTAGAEAVHRWLAVLDPEAAARIDFRNARRSIRALEVVLRTGRSFSRQSRRAEPRFRTLLLGLIRSRTELYERIDRRIDSMLAAGLVAEIAGLLDRGYSPELPAFSAIGYMEAARHLRGEIDRDEMAAIMKKRSRTLVRRQANWFKAEDPDIHWIEMDAGALDRAESLVGRFLAHDDTV
ncbi:MAG TPA: tRNA (adenosine(37)-N6)-dimethylallyltransferase MiaA [Anaerolineales bacterium]|nr:tRNA (adenosine(37)-N6)-dimethylallyltransferase MiaA [Anaerolineales bacterium]